MKKSYLLSGMLILVSGVVVYAMEPARPRVIRPNEFKMIDQALAVGDWQTIFTLLKATPGLVDMYRTQGGIAMSLLYLALSQGDLLTAETLLAEYNADPNLGLHLAIVMRNIPIIQFLLEHGANPDESVNGMTPRKTALKYVDPRVLALIESFDRK